MIYANEVHQGLREELPIPKMTAYEYWLWTELFVYVHDGKDYCEIREPEECPHCEWMGQLMLSYLLITFRHA